MSIICVDIGGTGIKLALAGETGLTEEISLDTLSHRGEDDVIERLCLAISQLAGHARAVGRPARAVGLACPGVIDPTGKIVVYSPNLQWHNIPLVEMLRQKLNLPVFMGNDANLYALGEYVYGAGEGRRDLVCFTLGTGVGGGIIYNGRVLSSQDGWAAELGHTIVVPGGRLCGCGAPGCLEAYASATGLQGMLREALANGNWQTSLRPEDGVKTIDLAARDGDQLGRELFRQAGAILGLGIINVVLTTGIEMIILGGGVAKGWDLMSQGAWRQIQESLKIINWRKITIEISKLGQNAPLLGAAAMARAAVAA